MPRILIDSFCLSFMTALAALVFTSTAIALDDTDETFLSEMTRHSLALEQRILEEGRPLTDSERTMALQAKVQYPDRVRILTLDAVPLPEEALLRQKLEEYGVLKLIGRAKGAAKGYGIIVTTSGAQWRTVIAHELVHVGQYERLGGIAEVMRYHLPDLKANGYRRSELEDEAYRRAADIVGTSL